MPLKSTLFIFSLILIVGGLVFWAVNTEKENADQAGRAQIIVFKSPTCGCCDGYVEYLRRGGLEVKAQNVRNILSVKEEQNIPPELESCHTAVAGDYFIEGHVPIEAVKKLISEKPEDILGIALPGMPAGSPGMGGHKQGKFEIQALLMDGATREFLSL
jgi:hypothetical protein